MEYRDKVVLVTGGTKGIGKGCVRLFVDAGAKVVFCARKQDEGDALASELNASGKGEAYFIKCDVSKTEQVQNLIDGAVEKYGRIDCLINNAGWHPPHRPIDGFSIEEFRSLLDLNLVSIFAACKFALPHLRKTKGNIINMSSLVGAMGQLYATTYVATKGAITAFTKARGPSRRLVSFVFSSRRRRPLRLASIMYCPAEPSLATAANLEYRLNRGA
jgi:NAD(P)-dependent dehydrogenase (short-subunit alcohol dehydrogenase family)